MVRGFCASGSHETVKCTVHAAAGILAATCAVYNIAAWSFRRQSHLSFNSVLYTLLSAWELKQTLHHLNACECKPATGPRLVETSSQAA